jgi:glycerol-3-phosphate acyltransferase PlsY
MPLTIIWKFAVGFLIGAIPFAKIAMIGTGVDITKVGSKNPGFNNVLRVSSKWRAALTLLGDVLKGYAALMLLSGGESPAAQWVIGIAAVMGHCWTPFVGFNGGKGVATTVGVLLFLDPRLTLPCLPLYVVLRAVGRKLHWRQEGAIASLATMFVIAALVLAFRETGPGVFAFAMLAIVVLRHLPNLREIMASKSVASGERSQSRSATAPTAPHQSQ